MADEEKSEEPTGKRIDEARKKGNVAKSNDLNQGVTLLVGVLALSTFGRQAVSGMELVMVESFRAIPDWRPGTDGLQAWLLPGALHVLSLIAPVSLSILAVALVTGAALSGLLFTTDVLTPDFTKVFSPAALAKFVSAETWIELVKNSVKMVMVGLIGFWTVWPHRGAFLEMAAWPLASQVSFTVDLALDAALRMALLLLVVGVADYFWRRHKRHEDLKMSKQEVKDEARQSEGDPNVKGKIRQLRRAMYRRFMMQEVPKATVVVTNPTHYAVALRYRQGVDRAPTVVAKGADHMAARIRQIAGEAGVPIVENPPLARALHAQVEPGDEVPGELYTAVAELLALVMGMARGRPVSMAARVLPLLLALLALPLASCSIFDEPAEKGPEATLRFSDGSGAYRGGEIVVRAMLSRCGNDPTRLSWSTGRALVLSRGQVLSAEGEVVMDSLVLRWDTLPRAPDSLSGPRDTLVFRLDGASLASAVLPLGNILPRLDSVQAGRALDSLSLRSVPLRGDTILVAVRPGEFAYIRLRTTDPDRNYPAQWRLGLPQSFPSGGSLDRRNGDPGDSVLLWRSPSALFDTTIACTLMDGQGQGRRRWLMRLSTYEERGSVWVGLHSDLAKFGISQGGRLVEVARLQGFRDVSGLDIDPAREGGTMVVADHVLGALRKYTSEGLARTVAATVRRPRSVGCDADGGFCWVGDEDSAGRGLLRAQDGASTEFRALPAGITALAVEQGGTRRAWFASLDSGFLGRTTSGALDSLLRGAFRRVKSISWDDSARLLWVADEGAGQVVALDSTFRQVRRITGLSRPGAVSAGGGRVWVAETGAGTVRLYGADGALRRTHSGFAGPQAVAILPHQPDLAWVADTENGRLVLVSSESVEASTAGQGMGRPNLLAVHRGAP